MDHGKNLPTAIQLRFPQTKQKSVICCRGGGGVNRNRDRTLQTRNLHFCTSFLPISDHKILSSRAPRPLGGLTEIPKYHPPQEDDKPDSWDRSDDQDESTTSSSSSESDDLNEDEIDLYEAYLRDQPFPLKYDNEHKKFLAAKAWMKKTQQRKMTSLLQDWQEAREHVDQVRKTDPPAADRLSKEITERFQNLYSVYEKEHNDEREQLVALHLQRVQGILNERKRETMDDYLSALDEGDEEEIVWALHAYIKAEEKDRIHTVNHYEHVRYTSAREAKRIHPFIVNHLRLTEQRIDQALEMLTRYPDIEAHIRPEIEEFMKQFNAIAKSIREVVLPVPQVDESVEDVDEAVTSSFSESAESSNSESDYSDSASSDDSAFSSSSSKSFDSDSAGSDSILPDSNGDDDDDVREDEHDYEKNHIFARRMQDTHKIRQGLHHKSVSSGHMGSTIGFALGGVSLFVIVVVAAVMVIRRRNNVQFVSHSYVEVDPSASPEDRHVANMQMNGYENPTYMYFEQQPQNNPKA
ncbi:beta-amyloid protein [Plakobranchus ocellatus]|uniref:Beta-amyloid protein n=1 Tax=Plakobranchus ocellatus TaxID=259542 RepID=A0AAV3Z521_9GAST|nr:beta-amyloid protein [Plakobranchus ocellatus]